MTPKVFCLYFWCHFTSRVYFYIPANNRGRIKAQSSTPQPRGYTFIYPRTKRVTQHLGTFSTTLRVYFYIPTNKEDYTKPRNFLHNLAGILLCTRNKTEYITHNYSSQTKVSATIFTPSRVYFYVPVNRMKHITHITTLHSLTGSSPYQ